MTAPSCSALSLFVQAVGSKQVAPSLHFIGFLLGQIPFIISYLILHEICVGVQQTVQQSLRRGHILSIIPNTPRWLPSHQRVAMAGEYDFIERVLLKVITENGQHSFKGQHQSTPYT